jgi:hypothetical protein
LSYACVFQPHWAGSGAVQFAIPGGEKFSR